MNIKTFYLIASILMIVSVLGQGWNLDIIWNSITIGAKISNIAGMFFNVLLVILFLGLYKMTPNLNTQVIDNKEMDKFLEQIKNEAK
mgnify:CR=1 FL=1